MSGVSGLGQAQEKVIAQSTAQFNLRGYNLRKTSWALLDGPNKTVEVHHPITKIITQKQFFA